MTAPVASLLRTYSELVARAELAARLGYQYGGDRNIYQALGYPTQLEYSDFVARYERQDIARAIIDKPVNATWQGGVLIQEVGADDTPLERAWKKLVRRRDLSVPSKLSRLDKLVGLGEYAVLLFGLSDVKSRDDFQRPVAKRTDLLYLRAFGEGSAQIDQWERNPSSPRFGMPLFYSISVSEADSDIIQTLRVHHTRVLHVAGNVLQGTVKGQSRLYPLYNRLMDLEKLVGGSAEMFWRGARPGYAGKLEEGYTLTKEDEEELQHQLDEFEHNLRRFLMARGIDIAPLSPQLADPSSHVDVQIQMISAVTGIPKRILTGSERGELASTQDETSWYSTIDARRTNFVEPEIVRPFVDTCISFGILPPPKNEEDGYQVVWRPLYEQSDEDQARVGQIRADTLAKYASQPTAEMIVPPDAFYQYFLGFSEDQIDKIKELQEAAEGEIVEGEEGGEPAVKGAPLTTHGGPGSGNFGHAGRPGKIGGSAKRGTGSIFAEEDYVFHRGSDPRTAEYVVLAADDRAAIMSYGEDEFAIPKEALTNEVPDWVQEYAESYYKEKYGGDYDGDFPTPEVNPKNIVDSADVWDDPDFVSQFYQDNYDRMLDLVDSGVHGFKTNDGAVIFPGPDVPCVKNPPEDGEETH